MKRSAKSQVGQVASSPHKTSNVVRKAVSPARMCAFEILRRVVTEGAYASVLLATTTAKLKEQDRALCYEMVLGVLRRRLWLDSLIELLVNGRKLEKLDPSVITLLRVSLYQLRFLTRVPPSAVVNDAVNMTRKIGVKSAASFVNAVLRRAVREPQIDPAINIEDQLERIAVETSHPAWLIKRWAGVWDVETAEAFARANNAPAAVAIRCNEMQADASEVLEQLRQAGAEVSASKIASGAWLVRGAGQTLRKLSEAGVIYLQDEASQLVAHVLNVQKGERMLDVCAAPGSKTTHAGMLARDEAKIVAGDKHFHRLMAVKDSARRQRLENISLIVYDAEASLPFVEAKFDRVLVDAPCSGTGTLRRNPEIRWRITESDIVELAERQSQILTNAARMVRVGGTLLYSTCSVEVEENEQVVERFLLEHQHFKIMSDVLEKSPASKSVFGWRTWTHTHDTDGFFIAPLIRIYD